MSQNTTRDSDEESLPADDDRIEIRSPYRPYPLGAKKKLREADPAVEFPDDDNRCAYVSELPPDDLLEEYELSVVRTDDPEEVWEVKGGETVEIFADRVERNGAEIPIDPEEAKKKAREQDYFTCVSPDDTE
jgi:hypothetical protein